MLDQPGLQGRADDRFAVDPLEPEPRQAPALDGIGQRGHGYCEHVCFGRSA